MILPQHDKLISFLFGNYIRMILNRHFHKIVVSGDMPDPGKSVLLVGNHFSWWDGFIAWYLNSVYLKKRFHIMMLEEQLSRWRFFTRLGAFSIQPESRSVIESLDFSGRILTDPENLLVMYPQGEIQSMYNNDFSFSRGVIRIIRSVENNPPGIIFYGALTEYFSQRRPSLFIYLKSFSLGKDITISEIENGYNSFYRYCISRNRT